MNLFVLKNIVFGRTAFIANVKEVKELILKKYS